MKLKIVKKYLKSTNKKPVKTGRQVFINMFIFFVHFWRNYFVVSFQILTAKWRPFFIKYCFDMQPNLLLNRSTVSWDIVNVQFPCFWGGEIIMICFLYIFMMNCTTYFFKQMQRLKASPQQTSFLAPSNNVVVTKRFSTLTQRCSIKNENNNLSY